MMVPLHVRHRQTDGVTQHDAQNSKVCVIVEYNWTGFSEKRNPAEKNTWKLLPQSSPANRHSPAGARLRAVANQKQKAYTVVGLQGRLPAAQPWAQPLGGILRSPKNPASHEKLPAAEFAVVHSQKSPRLQLVGCKWLTVLRRYGADTLTNLW